jgi:phosphohistidine phosphatase
MHLFLMRHGDALPVADTDASRPLSSLGERQSVLVGTAMKHLGISVDILLCSPLERARQTAGKIQEIIPVQKFILTDHLTPASDHRNIFNELQSFQSESIMCVGHEPHLSIMVSMLISGSRNARIAIVKASLACLEVSRPVLPGRGVMKWLITPETIQTIAYR